jgi:hypothetical protein
MSSEPELKFCLRLLQYRARRQRKTGSRTRTMNYMIIRGRRGNKVSGRTLVNTTQWTLLCGRNCDRTDCDTSYRNCESVRRRSTAFPQRSAQPPESTIARRLGTWNLRLVSSNTLPRRRFCRTVTAARIDSHNRPCQSALAGQDHRGTVGPGPGNDLQRS